MNGNAIIGIIIISLFITGIVFLVRKSNQNYKNAPDTKVEAKVCQKTTKISGMYAHSTSYYMSFEFSDGKRKNFRVGLNVYNTTKEGDTGVLTYKDFAGSSNFINFKR